MDSSANVVGDERMRLFVAYTLAPDDRERLSAWQRTELAESRARLVPQEQLHFTVAFLGQRPREEVEPIFEVIRRAAQGAGPMSLELSRYRESRSVGMLVFEDNNGESTRVAETIQRRLEEIGVYKPVPGFRTSPFYVFAGRLGCIRNCPSWGRSCRPRLLPTIQCCAATGRSTTFSDPSR
jgi:hypothetical protein